MENWTLDKWVADLDDCAKRDLYFEISGHDAGALRDRINHLREENDRQRYDIMLLNSYLQTKHEIIRIKLTEDW